METRDRKHLWKKSLVAMKRFLEHRLALGSGKTGATVEDSATLRHTIVTPRTMVSEAERDRILFLIRVIDSALDEMDDCDMPQAAKLYVDTIRRVARYSRAAAAAGRVT